MNDYNDAAAGLASLPMTAPQETELRQHVYDGVSKSASDDEHVSKKSLDAAWRVAKDFRENFPRNAKSDEIVSLSRRELSILRNFPKTILAAMCELIELGGTRRRELEVRVEALERGLSYEGTHEIGKQYERNNLLTDNGSLWIAIRTTTSRPGTDDAWRLCCKRGKNGRDAT